MSEVFGTTYAGLYDVLYEDKDYAAECDLIERALGEHGLAGRRLLDLGCGTGGHALPLAGRGYEVVGVDRSPAMLAAARAKAAHGPAVSFVEGDVRTVDLGRRFDAVLMMFAVLGYQYENADLLAALVTVRRHLRPGGLFLFDVWYGPAVLADRPGPRIKTITRGPRRILRTTEPVLDTTRHLCRVHFGVLQIEGDRVVAEDREEHLMRFFFPLELDMALAQAGMRIETLRAFPGYDRAADDHSWNAVGVARAVGAAGRFTLASPLCP